MKGKRLAALLGMGVVAGLLVAPASAEVKVPEEALINDPFGDGNFVNDQGNGGSGLTAPAEVLVPHVDDNATPEDMTATADIGKVWFSATADTVSAHIQTESPAPAEEGVFYKVQASPGAGSVGSNAFGCLRFWAAIPGNTPGGGTYQGPPWVRVHDVCNVGTNRFSHSADAQLTIEELEDGTGVITITADRTYSPLLAGDVLITKLFAETSPLIGGAAAGTQLVVDNVKYDTTKFGSDTTVKVEDAGRVPCARVQRLKGNLILGTPEADELHGTVARDIICGLKGDDVIIGYDDKDVILGGEGLDEVHGSDGNDDLRGDAGNDKLDGGTGVDRLNGGADNDNLNGGAGSDRLVGSKGKDVCRSGGGINEIRRGCEK